MYQPKPHLSSCFKKNNVSYESKIVRAGRKLAVSGSQQYWDSIQYELKFFFLTFRQYSDFTKSRQLSFHGKFRKTQKFLDWLSVKHGEDVTLKLRPSTYDILVYLAKETIAQIIDYVFLLRQDRLAVPGNPYSRAAVLNAHSTLRKEIYGSDTKVFANIFLTSLSSKQINLSLYYF